MQQYDRAVSIAVRRRTSASAALALVVVAATAPAGGCRRTSDAPPVASVTVTTSAARAAVESPLDVTFAFTVLPGASIAGDYRVFVHVLDASGQVLWNDDHDPPTPTSQWQAGQTIQYTRTEFVPPMARPGAATIEVGLYREGSRLALQGPAAGRETGTRAYRVAALEITPASDNIFLIYKNGWYPDELTATDPSFTWRWTQKSAALAFRNPRTDVTVFLQYTARPDLFAGTPQQVTIWSGDKAVATFAADSSDTTLRRIPIDAADLGTADMAEIRIDVDRTYTPSLIPGAGKDDRTLGIRVYHVNVQSR
ncbi:MAG TPA: hypothetical protein VG736_01080 [Vicinamibacterales bacterium]|jgi:hypothetical protein|nr:hypothetical protein [Vicinamibacterales bacterium]